MDGEADILQDRVEVLALDRRFGKAQKRVRCRQDEGEKGRADPALHGQHVGLERLRQIAAEGRDRRAEQRQDQRPEQHGAFVIAPDAGELVDQRLFRMGVLDHVEKREVGNQISIGERRKGDGDEQELHHRSARRHRHRAGRVTAKETHHRQDRLGDGDRQGQNQGKVAEFYDHAALA